MKKRFDRSRIIMIFDVLLLVCILIAPFEYERWRDVCQLAKSHKLSQPEFSLDSKAKDIPYVLRIHNMLNTVYIDEETNVSSLMKMTANADNGVDFNLYEQEDRKKILKKIVDAGIVDSEWYQSEWKKIKNDRELLVSDANMLYQTFAWENAFVEIIIKYDGEYDKIIGLTVNGTDKAIQKTNEEVAKLFVKYLGLEILEDWKWTGEKYMSRKAHLSVNSANTENGCSIQIESEGTYLVE